MMKDSKKFWNKQAKKFYESGSEESSKLIGWSMPYLSEESVVLDFACGTGQSTLLLAEHSKKVVGIDYSEDMIRYAMMNNDERCDFMVGSLDHGDLKKGTYDVVTAFNIFHLLDDLEETAQKMYDLLKPGGVVISYTACVGDKKGIMSWVIGFLSKINVFPKVNALSVDTLEKRFLSSGFEIVERKKVEAGVTQYYLVLKK